MNLPDLVVVQMSSSESLSMVILISVIALTSIGVNNELSSSKFHVLEERSIRVLGQWLGHLC